VQGCTRIEKEDRSAGDPMRDTILAALRQAAPYALVLALALGAVVVAGAHYSNAFPSADQPFGWPGPASFENAVAMVRGELVLAASLPALMLGARALRGRDAARDGIVPLPRLFGVHAALLGAGVALAAGIGAWGAGRVVGEAVFAFWVAHTVLALSFYSLAFLWACYLREHALAAAAATWLAFVTLYEAITRTILFRTEGYHNLQGGAFPDWFWVAQALSPLSSYTGILILWRERFRDYMERAALEGAVLPAWLVPSTFVGLALVLWILLPFLIGLAGWRWRARASLARAARRPSSSVE